MTKTKNQSSSLSRRKLFKIGLVSGIAVPLSAPMSAIAQAPNRKRPQRGDALVFDDGDYRGELVKPELMTLHQQPLAAFAKDPETGTLRDGSRLNKVMLVKVDIEKLSPRTQANAADGIVAYSAVCTHTGCDVSNWDSGELRMTCPCHESEFDIYDGGKVVGGPAPKALAMLPLAVTDGVITVAGAFKGRVGFQQAF